MTDDFSCDTCLRYGTVVITERDGQVLRLRHDPCPTCHGTVRAPEGQHSGWTRWPGRIAAQTATRLREHGLCPHCLGARVVVTLGAVPSGLVEAPCPACTEDG